MEFEVLKYGYLGLLALQLYYCYRIITKFQSSEKPFIQTIILVILFLTISAVGGIAGYNWASKELQVVEAKESAIGIIKEQISVARTRLETATSELRAEQQKALEEANNVYKLDQDRDKALKRAIQIAELIQQYERNYQVEMRELGLAVNGN